MIQKGKKWSNLNTDHSNNGNIKTHKSSIDVHKQVLLNQPLDVSMKKVDNEVKQLPVILENLKNLENL